MSRSTRPDALMSSLRDRYGAGELTFHAVPAGTKLLVTIVDRDGKVRTGSGESVSLALRNLLDGGCAHA